MNTSLQTPTPDLDRTVAWYTALGFVRTADHGSHAVFTDGDLRVLVDPARTARAAIVLHDAADLVAALQADGIPLTAHEGRHLLGDPAGTLVWLDPDAAPDLPGGPPTGILGSYQGLSIEALDMAGTTAFWTRLGFERTKGGPDQGWVELTRPGGGTVSVMGMLQCPHLFRNPGPTYFNGGNNPAVLDAIRTAGVPLLEEVTAFTPGRPAENALLADPAGTTFFVFND